MVPPEFGKLPTPQGIHKLLKIMRIMNLKIYLVIKIMNPPKLKKMKILSQYKNQFRKNSIILMLIKILVLKILIKKNRLINKKILKFTIILLKKRAN